MITYTDSETGTEIPILGEDVARRLLSSLQEAYEPQRCAPSHEEIARELADEGDDGCFDRIDEWEGREEWEREAYPDDYPASDYEDARYWTRLAARLVTGGLLAAQPTVEEAKADAFDEGLSVAIEAAIADNGYGDHQYPPNPYRSEADHA